MGRPRGRPPHEPTDEARRVVWEMTAFGIPQERVAHALGIDRSTLLKYYREELDSAADAAVTNVARNLYSKAIGDGREAMTAAIFFLKTRGKWSERDKDDRQGGNAGTLTIRWEDDRDRPTVSTEGGAE